VSGRFSRDPFIKLTVVTGLVLGGAALLALGYDLEGVVRQGLDLIRSTGPATFFLCMALLPAVGVPLSFFSLTTGSVFGPQLGMPLVLALSLAAITANMALSYLLASWALRPPLQSLLKRLGYRLPHVDSRDVTDLIVLLRATPGMPFPVQNYLLGLAAAPFVRYLLVSCLIVLPINAVIIFFGEAVLHGRGKIALIGLLVLLALLAAIHLVRKRYGAQASSPSTDPAGASSADIRVGAGG
jgi:uncharacterized membrane protein YdjX (TVP38/TMEM64 family)